MVTITIDVPNDINKGIEHFKIDNDLKDKREAIVLLLKRCFINAEEKSMKDVFKCVDKLPKVKISTKQLRKMKEDMYGG